MKILVTGGLGFIGSSLVDKLISCDHEVAVYDSQINFIDKPKYYKTALSHRKKIFKNIPQAKYKANIRDLESLNKSFNDFKPEIIVHLAGLPIARPLEKY